MRTYYEDMQAIEDESRQIHAAIDFDFQKVVAEMLKITIEEVQDFLCDTEIDIWNSSLEEIERAYTEYCAEYDIPCEQCADYACYDRMGW